MKTYYKVVKVIEEEVGLLPSKEDAFTTIMTLQIEDPTGKYEIQEVEVSAVRPGFGRDPDLH